jgi:mediator of RNA polymerase II transcription subunit 5
MATQSAIASWQKFLNHSLVTRLDPEPFTTYIRILSSKSPLSPSYICSIFLRPQSHNDTSIDPRILRYLQILLAEELVDCASVLRALLKYSSLWTFRHDGNLQQEATGGTEKAKGVKEAAQRWKNSYSAEEMMLYRLAKTVSSGAAPKSAQEAVEILVVCIQWMEMVTTAMGQGAHEMLNPESHAEDIGMLGMALGTLLVAVVGNAKILEALEKGHCQKGTGICYGTADNESLTFLQEPEKS